MNIETEIAAWVSAKFFEGDERPAAVQEIVIQTAKRFPHASSDARVRGLTTAIECWRTHDPLKAAFYGLPPILPGVAWALRPLNGSNVPVKPREA